MGEGGGITGGGGIACGRVAGGSIAAVKAGGKEGAGGIGAGSGMAAVGVWCIDGCIGKDAWDGAGESETAGTGIGDDDGAGGTGGSVRWRLLVELSDGLYIEPLVSDSWLTLGARLDVLLNRVLATDRRLDSVGSSSALCVAAVAAHSSLLVSTAASLGPEVIVRSSTGSSHSCSATWAMSTKRGADVDGERERAGSLGLIRLPLGWRAWPPVVPARLSKSA